MSRIARPEFDRFIEKISIDSSTLCWNWTGARFTAGYGAFWLGGQNGQSHYAHRWAYEFFVGPVPEGLELDHLCRNRPCANPDHLEAVTHQVNVLRGNQGALERSKTSCPHGHPYDSVNTWTDKEGFRHCRTCHRTRERQHKQAIREAVTA